MHGSLNVKFVNAYKTYLNKSECYIFHTTKTFQFGHRNVKNIGLRLFLVL